jgi:hypothetical protein
MRIFRSPLSQTTLKESSEAESGVSFLLKDFDFPFASVFTISA